SVLIIMISVTGFTQKKCPIQDFKYRRSSLHTMIIESNDFIEGKKDIILKAYNNAPFPDKYNNHCLKSRSFKPEDYAVTNEEKIAAGFKKTDKALSLVIEKYIKKEKIGNALVAKWFDRKEDGTFDMNLIGERGFYNASDLDVSTAKGTARGTACLNDAGEELISNTFFIVNKVKFVNNEIVAALIRDAAYFAVKDLSGFKKTLAVKAADIIYNKTKEGYSVWTSSYLYKLKWTPEVANTFYCDLWMDKTNIDAVKKAAFDNSDIFQLEFVGKKEASSLVTFSFKDRTEEEILTLATVRNVNTVYSKLQKKYDVFKTKTPIISINPVTAQIGMKEGLTGGEKFEILEQVVDQKTGLTKYVKKGKIKVKKGKVWDNRFNAGESKEGKEITELHATTFKGGKKCYPGMLIRQIK
ncbi:MAG: hypothetical protein WBG43_06125, partial [Marinifilaceae bacterium]